MILSDRRPADAGGAPQAERRWIDIVEPTLVNEAGHCAALFRGLRSAAPDLRFRLWIDRRALLQDWNGDATRVLPIFWRHLRRIQALLLYRRLLRTGARILVPTASYFDLRALDFVSRGRIPPLRVHLYFHKLRSGERRAKELAAVAKRQPDFEVFGTSEEIVDRLRAAGFARVARVLPVLSAAAPPATQTGFRTLLSAGAARADKGFGRIVDLVELLAQRGATLPIAVQASGDHYDRHDDQTAADLARLRRIRYAPLELITDTLDATQYARLFPGAICLQPYSPAEYADKMSAVTFDALRAGAPIITLDGTTMARIVRESGAGIVLDSAAPQELLRAVEEAVAGFAVLQEKALAAGEAYRPEASWEPMVVRLRRLPAPVKR